MSWKSGQGYKKLGTIYIYRSLIVINWRGRGAGGFGVRLQSGPIKLTQVVVPRQSRIRVRGLSNQFFFLCHQSWNRIFRLSIYFLALYSSNTIRVRFKKFCTECLFSFISDPYWLIDWFDCVSFVIFFNCLFKNSYPLL